MTSGAPISRSRQRRIPGLMVVRPHADRIRERVFALLEAVGVNTVDAQVLPPGTPDDEALALIRRCRPRAMLVPLHAHRTSDGALLDGITLVRRIDAEIDELAEARIFMPATPMGRSTLELALARDPDDGGLSARLRRRLVVIPIAELDDPGLVQRVSERMASEAPAAIA